MTGFSAEWILSRFIEREYRLDEIGRVELSDSAEAIEVTAYTPGGQMLREIEVSEPAAWVMKLAAFSATLIKDRAPEGARA